MPNTFTDYGYLLAALTACLWGIPALAAEPALVEEPNRPQFHYTPQRNWMNDPNGLVHLDGEYHVFHQYNPHGDTWGHMSWAHAVSHDLVHWEHLPVALHEENGVMIFSGSAVVDHHNTSGFGQGGKPPLVAIYTGHTPQEQTQHIAYSTDKGRTWTKYAGNPVLDENLKDFRDPKVIWHVPTKQWVMVVSLSDQHKVRFYGSKDLKVWQKLGEFGGEGCIDGIWECPDLFELHVTKADRAAADQSRWVLIVNIGGGTPAGGSGVQYFVGGFDGKTFKNDNDKATKLWADYGPDFYAGQSWSDIPASDGRRVWLGWMSNWRYAHVEPTKPWRTAQSLPRELKLIETPDGVRLAQSPVKELETLRGERLPADAFSDAGQALEIVASFDPDKSARIGVCGDGAHETVIGYNSDRREIYVDRTKSRPGEPFHEEFPARYAAPIVSDAGAKVTLRVFVDRTSVEVFADDGTSVITANTFPAEAGRRLSVHGDVSLRVWRLKSIWESKSGA